MYGRVWTCAALPFVSAMLWAIGLSIPTGIEGSASSAVSQVPGMNRLKVFEHPFGWADAMPGDIKAMEAAMTVAVISMHTGRWMVEPRNGMRTFLYQRTRCTCPRADRPDAPDFR